jgi:hypothetical protein
MRSRDGAARIKNEPSIQTETVDFPEAGIEKNEAQSAPPLNPPPVTSRDVSYLIDRFLPEYDTSATYSRIIPAPVEVVYRALQERTFGQHPVIRFLFALRSFASFNVRSESRGVRLKDLGSTGFMMLGERPPDEIVIGVVGRFWRPTGNIRKDVKPEAFMSFFEPGYCKAAWNFRLVAIDERRTEAVTETRVHALDPKSRFRFRLYWTVVGPFSGLIRVLMLRELEAQCRQS